MSRILFDYRSLYIIINALAFKNFSPYRGTGVNHSCLFKNYKFRVGEIKKGKRERERERERERGMGERERERNTLF